MGNSSVYPAGPGSSSAFGALTTFREYPRACTAVTSTMAKTGRYYRGPRPGATDRYQGQSWVISSSTTMLGVRVSSSQWRLTDAVTSQSGAKVQKPMINRPKAVSVGNYQRCFKPGCATCLADHWPCKRKSIGSATGLQPEPVGRYHAGINGMSRRYFRLSHAFKGRRYPRCIRPR
jgi:hypothetical protein